MSLIISLVLFIAAQGYIFDFLRKNFDSMRDNNKMNYIVSGVSGYFFSIPVLFAVLVAKLMKKRVLWDFGVLRPVVGKLFGVNEGTPQQIASWGRQKNTR